MHASPFAGRWYPAVGSELRALIDDVLDESSKRANGFTRPGGIAFVVPHAAPEYSGTVAAAAYRHIAERRPKRIVLLGFSHRGGIKGIAVPNVDEISTPLGVTQIDVEAASAFQKDAGLCDHSVEIQLPFLTVVAPDAKVLPLYAGHLDEAERGAAASQIRELLDGDTVLIASSDLTHYGRDFGFVPFPHDELTGTRLSEMDAGTMKSAGSLDAGLFLDELGESGSTVCGYEPIALLLEVLSGIAGDEIFQETLDYQTSGEITGDYSHSVSYGALGYFPYRSFTVSDEASQNLMDSARRTLEHLRATGEQHPTAAASLSELDQRLPVFVTLYQSGELLGCIGQVRRLDGLRDSVPHLTLSAALEDDRFEPLRPGSPVEIEISVLSPFKRIADPSPLIAGEHGGMIENVYSAGLLLPKVASERGWDRDQFLTALARKAGVGPDAYSDPGTHLSIFRAQVLKEV